MMVVSTAWTPSVRAHVTGGSATRVSPPRRTDCCPVCPWALLSSPGKESEQQAGRQPGPMVSRPLILRLSFYAGRGLRGLLRWRRLWGVGSTPLALFALRCRSAAFASFHRLEAWLRRRQLSQGGAALSPGAWHSRGDQRPSCVSQGSPTPN